MHRQLAVLVVAVGFVALVVAPLRAGVLGVPAKYTPDKPWPVMVSFQDNPDPALTVKTSYFLVHSGDKGMVASKKFMAEMRSLAGKYNIDPMRIYGTGFSRGGQEVEEQAWCHPDWFAAIAPMCSDLRDKPDRPGKSLLPKWIMTPTLLMHGDGDSFIEDGKQVFELMKSAGCPVEFKTFPGGHAPGVPFKQDVKVLTDFFDKHTLEAYPKSVVHVVTHPELARAFWVDALVLKAAGAPPAKDAVAAPSGSKPASASAPAKADAPTGEAAAPLVATYKVKVKEGNRIEVEANDQVAELDLYLNDKLVDMAKPVTVTMGEKKLFEGAAASPVKVKIREGETAPHAPSKPLWEELTEIKKGAKYPPVPPASKPAEAADK